MKDQTFLEDLGLTKAEAQVYLALLQSGPSSIRKIATVANINRGTTYDALKRLSTTGLVSYRKRGERQHYMAESPDQINTLITERRRELVNLQAEAQTLIPKLMAIGERRQGEPIVRFYEDDAGVVAILNDVLATTARLDPKEYYVYSSLSLRGYLYRRFPTFTKRRLQNDIFVRVIAVGEGGEPAEEAELKWLPEPKNADLSSYVIIYGNKVATISVSPDETPYGVVIEEAGVAAMQKFLFEQLWDKLDS